jgi:hypothetical protein
MIDNFDLLIREFKENRESLKNMITELDKFKEKIYIIFPDKVDNRYIRFFEEKVKAVTALFGEILNIRKEINKSLKDEIELKRRLDDDESGHGESIDIRSLAAKIELLNKKPELKENII